MSTPVSPSLATPFTRNTRNFGTAKKVAVIGGGVVGVTTAQALLQSGCAVHVFEKGSTVALNSSFAGGGVAALGSANTLASPEARGRFLRQSLAFRRHAALRWQPATSLRQWGFVAKLLRHSTQVKHALNQAALLRLAHYSHSIKAQLDAQLPFDHEQTQGSLQLFRSVKDLDRAVQKISKLGTLDAMGIAHQALDADQCRTLEPALNAQAVLAGGIAFAGDSAANTALYTKQLKQVSVTQGAVYHFETQVMQLISEAGGWRVMTQSLGEQAQTSSSEHFDAVVLATGADSLPLFAAHGVKVPLYPLRGYSLTVPITSLEDAPLATVMDEQLQVSMTRLGLRLRVSGQSEIGSAALRERKGKNAGKLAVREAPVKTLSHVMQQWFPYASKLSEASYWCGTYPTLADGAPLIGATPVAGLYLNMGHGANGWGLCFGAAQLLADAVIGKAPQIDTQGLTLARLA